MNPISVVVFVVGSTWLAEWLNNTKSKLSTGVPWRAIVAGFIVGFFLTLLSQYNPRIANAFGALIVVTAALMNGPVILKFISK